jgi:hypothetical protein
MERQGFAYAEAERPSLAESRTHGYVSDDVNWARTYGYGSRISAKEDRARVANPNIAYRQGLSEERRRDFDQALNGGPDATVLEAKLPGGGTVRRRVGGCLAEAETKLYGDSAAWFRAHKITSNLQPLYVPKMLADKKFRAALSAWADCMRRAGHPYKDPKEARAAALDAKGLTEAQAFARERGLAQTDATCAKKTRLKTIGRAREDHYVNTLPREYRRAMETVRRMERSAFARAEALVGPRS